MKALILCLMFYSSFVFANIREVVYVESPTDTDKDGKLDLIYVSIDRASNAKNQHVIYKNSPYAEGGNQVDFYSTDVDLLPQDEAFDGKSESKMTANSLIKEVKAEAYQGFADVYAHSLGTGKSTGCPSVGDISETLAAKAVIDWLNGRAKAFDSSGKEVKADWASGNVGMIGVSYNGTLPTMVATTGVEGLKAIVPIAAISNWYNYYRANGLVVNPGGYEGEDADVLGRYIVRKRACENELQNITKLMGREHGDFNKFWQDRNYLPQAKNIKAAVFIAHGQSDWNVKQKHAVDLWNALSADTPKRMFLHSGGHSYPSDRGFRNNVQKWFDHYVKGELNDINDKPAVRVNTVNENRVMEQESWPHENTFKQVIPLGLNDIHKVVDIGADKRLEVLTQAPTQKNSERVILLSDKLEADTLFSGTVKVNLMLSVLNRAAANITVAIVKYSGSSRGTIMTRGWADPQNYRNLSEGELLTRGVKYNLSFEIEPKQFKLRKGERLGVLLTSTDNKYTLRPSTGTELEFFLGDDSSIELFGSESVSNLIERND